MYELESWFNKTIQKFVDWLTHFFTKVAVYLLIIIIVIVVFIIFIVVIRSLISKDRYKREDNKK